jgi:mono/diheme cytochrome c family protein
MVSKALRLAVLLSAIATSPLLAQQTASQLANLRHWSGQSVAPVYEGFDVNGDGSFNMWFGYMNRNYEEELEIPVGAGNAFEPGGDRGQPTHFTTRRHKDVFKVVVPKEFADKQLVWKLTSHGRTEQVIATLKPVWQIDRERTTRGGNSEKVSSNLPPVVKVDVAPNPSVTGASFSVSATDDGLPARRGAPVGLTVFWTKYRGPGAVSFTEPQGKLANGKAATAATFSEPGEYILQAVVDDGSGESAGNFGYHCCWTNTQVKLTVGGSERTRPTSTAVGRVLSDPASAKATPTFAKDIAPIFQKSCQTCHHPGTSAPMSLVSYDDVRPWARSIRQRVSNRDMPPWHLDQTVGIRHYKNDRSLSDDEIATVLKWVDSGAAQGNPADLPAPLTFRSEGDWFIGEPDLKVTTPSDFTMYPAGPDWWIDQYAEVQLTEDRWIKSMEIKPSNPKVVHHVVVYAIEPDAPEGTPESGVMLHEYAVGKYGDIFGENTGRLLKKGTRLRYDMHYFAVGSEQHNKTTIAFKFYPKGVTPKYQVRAQNIRNIPNDELEVPPNTVVRTDGYFRLPRPARIDAFQPHMHMRGRGMTVEAIDPVTNKTFILSSVDHFDFNWHINYVYADEAAPLLPAGTVLHLIGIHDNTAANRRNPDPNMWVGFGERSVDDMLQVWLDMVYLDDAEYQRLVEERKAKPATSSTAQQPQR